MFLQVARQTRIQTFQIENSFKPLTRSILEFAEDQYQCLYASDEWSGVKGKQKETAFVTLISHKFVLITGRTID